MGYRDKDGVYKPDKGEKDYAKWLVDRAKKQTKKGKEDTNPVNLDGV